MKVSDSQVPCQQLFTLSLEAECKLHIKWPKTNGKYRRARSLKRHLVADLSTVAATPWRNLSGSLFQLCQQYFIKHKEGLPEDSQKIKNGYKRTTTLILEKESCTDC